jgi:hypothetical protein
MRRRNEQLVHRAVVEHLRLRAVPRLLWFHVPNGGQRNKTEAAIFKGLGVQAGVSDLILLHDAKFFALELKAVGGKPAEAQLQFQHDVIAAGGRAAITIGLDAAIEQLEQWGLLCGTAMIRRDAMKERAHVAITQSKPPGSKFRSKPVKNLKHARCAA